MSEWKKTKYPGVRFREHETRKHGISKDRYFVIRYQRDGKRHEEGVGWASEGWTAEKAGNELAELKKAYTLGNGSPTRLTEKRDLVRMEEVRRQKEAVTFGHFFQKNYLPIAETVKKPKSYKTEKGLFEHWIKPVLGDMPFNEIVPLTIEEIKKNVLNAAKAPRTVQYVLATIRQVWNQARRDGLVLVDSPTKQVKIPKFDNRRTRFLSHTEADALLANLAIRDLTTWRMALLSLHTGMRAGELFSLVWGRVDLNRGLILIVDAKGIQRRAAYITSEVRSMFEKMERGGPTEYVFTQHNGKPFSEMATCFEMAVKDLKFNTGITDRRERVSFHSLRHTHASWQIESGTDLYVVKKLLGHGTISMTERYSHLAPKALQDAVKNFERALSEKKQEPAQSEQNAAEGIARITEGAR